jgi:hypothetical protein
VSDMEISYFHDRDLQSFHVALDHYDMEKLREVVDRALAKDNTLRDKLGETNLGAVSLEEA